MNLTKKNIQKTSGIHKEYKPGQLITINNRVFRIVRGICRKIVRLVGIVIVIYIYFARNYH